MLALAAAACSSPAPRGAAGPPDEGPGAAALAAEARTSYRVSPGDLLSVTVYQDSELSRRARVDAEGAVSLPLVGAVPVAGKTVLEAQRLIEERLSKYLVEPQASVLIEEYGSKLFFVMGEVQKPGSYPVPVESKVTVLQAISIAGGLTRIAAPSRIRVLRQAGGKTEDFKVDVKALTRNKEESDLLLQPNDVIFVPQSFF